MILSVQIKLIPDKEQSNALLRTLKATNLAANRMSELCWQKKEFRRFPLQKLFYHQIRKEFPLSAQTVCLLTAKVADAYKLDQKCQRTFRANGSIAYDSHVLALYLETSRVSIWTIIGREKMPFVCGEKQRKILSYKWRQSDLILRKDKWFLNVTVDIPESKENAAIDVLGVDFGIVEIACDSDGNMYSGSKLNKIRNRNRSLRRKLQKKGTKSAKRLLKKRSLKESRFAANVNHCISKRIVQNAERTNRAIAIEDLGGIRSRIRARKRQRTRLHSWGFAQLGDFITYKAKQCGVGVIKVSPKNTSRRCNQCGHTEKANRKSRDCFVCKACGHTSHADENGASNIRSKGLKLLGTGALNHPNAETGVSQ